jgi:hypothetical protein
MLSTLAYTGRSSERYCPTHTKYCIAVRAGGRGHFKTRGAARKCSACSTSTSYREQHAQPLSIVIRAAADHPLLTAARPKVSQ